MKGPESYIPPQRESLPFVIEEPEMKEFIATRNVDPDSFPIIEELAKIDKETLINGMHNFFAYNRETAEYMTALKTSAQHASTEESRRMYELFQTFLEKTDRYTARHLVAVLERRNRPNKPV